MYMYSCTTHVLVVHHFHESEFSERSLSVGLVLERLHQFLDGHSLSSLVVQDRAVRLGGEQVKKTKTKKTSPANDPFRKLSRAMLVTSFAGQRRKLGHLCTRDIS